MYPFIHEPKAPCLGTVLCTPVSQRLTSLLYHTSLTLVALLFTGHSLQAQSPFSNACTNGDLYQVVSGNLNQYNLNNAGGLDEVTLCNSYVDPQGTTVDLGSYNSIAFDETQNLIYGFSKKQNQFFILGSDCVVQLKGLPSNFTGACSSLSSFPNNYSASFDENNNYYIFSQNDDLLIQVDIENATITNCLQTQLRNNGGSIPPINDLAWDATNKKFIGINGTTLYSIDINTGDIDPISISGTSSTDGNPVGSIFGLSDGKIIAFYNNSGNYYQIDPASGIAVLALSSSPNNANDGTSCSQTNIFCLNPLQVTATLRCDDGNGTNATPGEYYIDVSTNYDPANPGQTSATPDFTVATIINGVENVLTTTFDGVSSYIIGPFNAAEMLLKVSETDDGDPNTLDLCVDFPRIVVIDPIPCDNVHPILEISKYSDGGNDVQPDQIINYTVELLNAVNSPVEARNISLEDDIPAHTAYVASSATKTYEKDIFGTNTNSISQQSFDVAGHVNNFTISASDVPSFAKIQKIELKLNGESIDYLSDIQVKLTSPNNTTLIAKQKIEDTDAPGTFSKVLSANTNEFGTFQLNWYDSYNGENGNDNEIYGTSEVIFHFMIPDVEVTESAAAPSMMVAANELIYLKPGKKIVLKYKLQVASTIPADVLDFTNTVTGTSTNSIQAVQAQTVNNARIAPVVISEFKLSKAKSDALLNWSTATEINAERFDIERSYNGVDFQKIGALKAAGTSFTTQDYRYIDKHALQMNTQWLYYRLKQVDFDGQFEYSEVRSLRMDGSTESSKIFPNPIVAGQAIGIEADEIHSVALYNLQGQIIREKKYDGVKQINWYSDKIETGMYILIVNNTEKHRLIVTSN